jgi:gliding motility-associated lipoprotein GldH
MEKRITRSTFFLLFASIITLSSCNRDVLFSESAVMEKNSWNLMNILTFSVPVTDTVNSNNIIFTIRTGTSYPFRNIYLFVSTTSPDGKVISDTLQYELADEKGKWLGKGFGDIRELSLPYKSNVYFPVKGSYHFNIQHGMRAEDLKGVYDFGLRIVRVSK